MNNNKNDENALLAHCKGVFSKTGYISIGTAEKPLGYAGKPEVPERWKGKQMASAVPKEGKTLDAYFEKKYNWIADGDKYADRWRYAELQKEKKKGFGTSDFSKRDEFSNTVRTLQWREQLEHEAKWDKAALTLFEEATNAASSSGAVAAALPSARQDQEEPPLYDLVFEKALPKSAPAASKVHRDTKNRTHLSFERNYNGQLTTSRLQFAAPTDFEKPEFARRPLIRDTFYRKTNVFFPPGCDSTTQAP